MNAKVVIRSIGIANEIEWQEKIEAPTLRGAKSKASRWIKKNLFQEDFSSIKKEDIGDFLAYWTIR